MHRRTKWIASGAVALLALAGAGGIAAATGAGPMGNDDGSPITGAAYDKATSVALQVAGGGKVTQTEQGDEESYYQVEVTKADGTHVDVNLDQDFNLVKTKAEPAETGPETDDGPND